MVNIALYGGTFNPLHIGHIEIVKALCDSGLFDKIIVIPSYIPPHKTDNELLDEKIRYSICNKVFSEYDGVSVSDIELKRKGKSYTFDTLVELKNEYPGAKFFITCGGDMIMSLETWYKFEELKNLCTFIAFNRAGYSEDEFNNKIKELTDKGAELIVINKNIPDISSTMIRNKIKNCEKIDGLLPSEVIHFIQKNNYYR